MTTPEGEATLTAQDRSGDPPPRAHDLVPGGRIGRYVIERRLGAGGMGVVYAARDTELAREVALKLVRTRSGVSAMEARLRREAKAMARLSHRNVVPVFDIGTHDGELFVAMELVAGDSLRSWVARPRPWRAVVALFVKAGRGLEAAHAAGLVHRDFKPDNVVVGPGDEPRITDFGLARDVGDTAPPSTPPSVPAGEAELSQVTATGSLAGTPAYMAPEQLLGRAGGPLTDQFSFCISLFEVLYGARPFRPAAPRADALVAAIRAGRIPKPARGVPGWVHAVIVRGLAFEPARRWPSMAALADALEGRRRARRRRIAAAGAGLAIAAGAVVGAFALRGAPPAKARCLDLALKGNDATAVIVCQEEYARTNDPWVGRELADALRRTGKLKEAGTVANALLATPAQAGALYTLGMIAYVEDRRPDAERSLRLASQLHRQHEQWADSAADLQALALASDDAVEQLVIFNDAIADAQRGGNARVEAYCHVTAAALLAELGARDAAVRELERARGGMSQPRDALVFELRSGDVWQHLGDHRLAIAAFEAMRAGAEAVNSKVQALSARLNLAYSLAEMGRGADATAQLEAARVLDLEDRNLGARLWLEARIARHGGDLARAATVIERAIAATDPHAIEPLVRRHLERGEMALDRREFVTAEQSARRAIAALETLHTLHPPVELRSWLIVSRRAPYELLFAALAGRGDAPAALAVFDRIRGLGVLAGLMRGEGVAVHDDGVAFPVGDLGRLFPRLASSALASPAADAAVAAAVRAGSLLALVVVRGELWRITADAGRVEVGSLGPLQALRADLDRLRESPGDRAAAASLGERLIPAGLARPSEQVLHVVVDESLAWLPVAALRVGDRRLIAARPIAQLARPSQLGCAAVPPGERRLVAIDERGELARRIPGATGGRTRADVLDAARGDLLHLALPIDRDPLGESLRLGDERLRGLEIAGYGRTAAQVVLATPNAGTAGLALAFLAAGSDQVIAALRPVPEATVRRLTERLYRGDHGDLVRALARLQRAGDAEADDWIDFAVFGRETCNPQL